MQIVNIRSKIQLQLEIIIRLCYPIVKALSNRVFYHVFTGRLVLFILDLCTIMNKSIIYNV